MYLDFFGLKEKPFSITPDPKFLYLSDKHREGLAHLLYGTDENASFVVLTGEVGTGKTTLCRTLLDQAPKGIHFALILNPLQTPLELLASICDEFSIRYPRKTDSRKILVDLLNLYLLKAYGRGERCVLIIDEAQNISTETLEQLRLLTNFESGKHKLLKIILAGQPELNTVLSRPELRQLAQRVTARYHLQPLDQEETADYIHHRLLVAKCHRKIFTPGALRAIHRVSNGIPRLINLVCERALTGAYGQDLEIIDRKMIIRSNKELAGKPAPNWIKPLVFSTIALVSVLLLAYLYFFPDTSVTSQPKPATTEKSAPITGGKVIRETESVDTKENEEASATTNDETETDEQPDSNNELPSSIQESSTDQQGGPEVTTPDDPLLDNTTDSPSLEKALVARADNQSAFLKLFALWGIDYQPLQGQTACERARETGLRCIFNKGTLKSLQQLNRPAVLELFNAKKQRRQVVLSKIDDEQLTLQILDQQVSTTEDELPTFWAGNYLILWRPPPNGSTLLQNGDTGPDVLWLKQQLDQLYNESNDVHTNVFDAKLKSRIKHFQKEHGLSPDGVAGTRTIIKLVTALRSPGTPLLTQEQE